jgi:hypothetical protein
LASAISHTTLRLDLHTLHGVAGDDSVTKVLTHGLYVVGKAVIGGEPHAEVETDAMKLLARSNVELDVAVGSIVLFLLGFFLIISLGLLAESMWHSKLGAGVGGCICAIGITGYLLHYARSRVLRRRADRLDRGEPVQDPLKETFWTSSSDIDLVFQLPIGIVVLVLTYVS